MPIADLLGVQFDMQLLGKLSVSVVAVLLVSWAYKFYNSRARTVSQDEPRTRNAVPPGSCIGCNSDLRQRQKSLTGDAEKVVEKKENETKEDLSTAKDSVNGSWSIQKDTAVQSQEKRDGALEKDNSLSILPEIQDHEQGKSTLNSSPLSNNGHVINDVIELGSDLVVEKPGVEKMEERGKIYNYVESVSHSISDDSAYQSSYSTPVHRRYKEYTLQDACLMELEAKWERERGRGTNGGGISSSDQMPSLAQTSDSVFLEDPEISNVDSLTPVPSPRGRQGSGLNRKDSMLQIVDNSDLQIPFIEPRASTPVNSSSRTASSEDFCSSPMSSLTDSSSLLEGGELSLEVVARANFFQIPLDNIGSSELEVLKCKLDLGNCLQALSLARKHKLDDLQDAAFKVMSDNYLQVLRDPELYGKLKADDREKIRTQRLKGKRFLVVADMDPQDRLSYKSQSETEEIATSSSLHYYDDYKDSWHRLASLPKEVISKGCSMCTMDNYLFIAAGCQGTAWDLKPSKQVFCYNPVTGIWKEICPMNQARPQCKLVALQGYLYAVGGECLYTVERYDPRADRWTFVAPLPNDTFAVAHHATACNGQIFVSGGTLRYTLLRYNPKTNSWKESIITGCKEKTTEMVAVRSFIYRFDINTTLGISVYRYHAMAKLWYECCTKRLPYSASFQCTTIDNMIYCVNRQFTMRFLADEISPDFVADGLKVLPTAKGVLFPFVLVLPVTKTVQTRV
ncbi:kelch domain-containing protein 7A-like [Acipenser ruthenus]|uniref:kelch domain-containing protein 7A-like n=1 Tax=Acipenser ruthenus TaxID=7906 RepID=UPI00145BFA98|nr:kelch domain-containing protein 7A-like [Acipenser ruthenus]